MPLAQLNPKEAEVLEKGEKGVNEKIIAEDGCCLCDMDRDDPIVCQFGAFAECLKFVFLRFDPRSQCCRSLASHIALIGSITLSIYLALYDLYNGITDCKDPSFVTTLVLFIWCLQSVIAHVTAFLCVVFLYIGKCGMWKDCEVKLFIMLFLAKWQKDLVFEEFFHLLKHAKVDVNVYDKPRRASIFRNSLRFFFLLGCKVVLFAMLLYAFATDLQLKLFHPKFKYAFYFPQLRFLRLIQCFVNMLVWNVALHTYICLTNAMKWEVKKFNWQLAHVKRDCDENLQNSLLVLVKHHTYLSKCVRHLDSIFKVYAFMMIATVIPTMLFTVLALFTQKTAFEMTITGSSVLFTLYAFYGVTMSPAGLYEELDRSKTTLCTNMDVWIPYDEKSNALARTMGMHLNQDNLGITLWGFAMVTKSLILTTLSIMLTFLTLLLEFTPGKRAELNPAL